MMMQFINIVFLPLQAGALPGHMTGLGSHDRGRLLLAQLTRFTSHEKKHETDESLGVRGFVAGCFSYV